MVGKIPTARLPWILENSVCDSNCSCFRYSFVILEFPAALDRIIYLFIPGRKFNNCIRLGDDVCDRLAVFPYGTKTAIYILKRIHEIIVLARPIVNMIVSTASLFL